jgi:predicted nucleic acid-binding protein
MPRVVSDTGPIIALAQIGQIDILRRLFAQVLIPPAVQAEIRDETSMTALDNADWIILEEVKDTLAVQLLREELDAGESEAIVLAKEHQAVLLFLDERAATRKARSIGLQCIGTLGILLIAKEKGIVTELKPLLDRLQSEGFHMSDVLYGQVLRSANE